MINGVLRKLDLIGLSCFLATATLAANTPNILVIWGDDIGVHNISVCNV